MRIVGIAAARVSAAAITLLLASIVVFIAIHLVPGGFAIAILGPNASDAAIARLSEEFGLDRPLPEQYARWLATILRGDLGISLTTRQPIVDELFRRIPITLELAVMALAMALVIGLPLGTLGGIEGGSRVLAAISRAIGVLGISVPSFVLGSVLVLIFSSYQLGLGISGYVSPAQDLPGNLRNMVLPAFTLAMWASALISRTTRDAVRSISSEPFITAAVARGEPAPRIIRQHFVRNVAIPVVTVVATYFGYLLGGTVIIEQLFSLPGIGSYTLFAVQSRDYGVVMATTLLGTAVFLSLNVFADLSYALIDPRVGRHGGGRA